MIFPPGSNLWNCQSGFLCYHVSHPGNFTYWKAKSICSEMNATLPMPKTAKENRLIASLAKGHYYLGISDRLEEGTWRPDVPGHTDPLTWTNWDTSEPWPEPNGGTLGQCAFVMPANTLWFDTSCGAYVRQVVCEKGNSGFLFNKSAHIYIIRA